MAPDETPATLTAIRADIEETAAVYDLDGPARGSYPVSAAMVRHARALLAAIDALTAALERHQQWSENSRGVRLCGGCLEPFPCKDDPERIVAAALAGTGKEGGDAPA